MTANKTLTALIVSAVFTVLIFSAAAAAQSQSMAPQAQNMQAASGKITMADIDNALASGPVFVEFETKECGYCKQQKPISQALASDYAGKVTFLFVDATENRDMARAFQVSGVPQMDVIASKTDGKYVYVDKDGKTTDSLASSKFIGLTQKDTLTTALDAAVHARGQ